MSRALCSVSERGIGFMPAAGDQVMVIEMFGGDVALRNKRKDAHGVSANALAPPRTLTQDPALAAVSEVAADVKFGMTFQHESGIVIVKGERSGSASFNRARSACVVVYDCCL